MVVRDLQIDRQGSPESEWYRGGTGFLGTVERHPRVVFLGLDSGGYWRWEWRYRSDSDSEDLPTRRLLSGGPGPKDGAWGSPEDQ